MRVGTKSILFGIHCFFLHPWFVALAWWKLYGFPTDPRLWVAFFVHDLGYFGKPNMDGEEGETHPVLGSRIMGIFDKPIPNGIGLPMRETKWADFALLHSRYYSKKLGLKYSKLCVADKLAICVTPSWLYLFCGGLSGELKEYMTHDVETGLPTAKYRDNQALWYKELKVKMRLWVSVHKDGAEDTVTPATRH